MPQTDAAAVRIDGRYRIVGTIADGGMATVYKAVDERLGRTVAVKVIHTQLARGKYRDQFIERFHREASSAAAIANPHIVQVYDTGEYQGLQYLVMEYVHGVSLRQTMNTQGAFDVRECLRLLDEMLDGLAAAHAVSVVHRDIKPENILINSRGHVQITDFGLARATTQATLTTTGMLLGTAAYLPPEMIESNEATPQGDLYALGIVAWEMLAGSVPFSSFNAVSLLFKHVHEDIPALDSVCAGINPAVSQFIATLTARDPNDRPADGFQAHEMLRKLTGKLDEASLNYRYVPPEQHHKDGGIDAHDGATEPLIAQPRTNMLPGSGQPVPTPPNTFSQETATLSSALQLFDDGSEDAALATNEAPTEAIATNSATKHKRRTILVVVFLALIVLAGAGGAWWYYLGPGSYWVLPQPSDLTCEESSECVITDVSWKSYEEQLSDAGIPYTVEEAYSDTVERDFVISTEPGEVGAHISRRGDAAVSAVVSKGIQQVTIPNDILEPDSDNGKAPIEALKAAGLTNIVHDEAKDEYSMSIPEGVAVSITPEPGSTVPHNAEVTVQLSKGPMPVSMPDMVGRSKSDAQAALDDAKLKVNFSEEFSDTVASGNVISQSVEAGTQLHWGDSVDLVVSKGPETVTLPDVRGQNFDDAKSTLEGLGLSVKLSAPLGDIDHKVRLQSPDPGAQVRVRDTQGNATVVTLTVI